MAFNYDLTTDRGQVRLLIGDTVENSGVKPDGSNFSDAEIDYFLSSGGSVNAACALASDTLANLWTIAPIEFDADGLKLKRAADMVEQWRKNAEKFRQQATGGLSVSHAVTYGSDYSSS